MSDDPTTAELARTVAQIRADFRDDLADIRRQGDAAVTGQVYAADQRLADERYAVLRDRLDRMDKAIGAESRAMERWRQARDKGRKWWIAAVIIPIGGVVVEIVVEVIFAIRGGK